MTLFNMSKESVIDWKHCTAMWPKEIPITTDQQLPIAEDTQTELI